MDTDYVVPTDVDRIQARVLKVSDDGVGETETWSQEFLLSSEEGARPRALFASRVVRRRARGKAIWIEGS